MGFYVFDLILLKNEPKIGRRPIKEDILSIIKFYWKMSQKSADNRGFYVLDLNLLKNEPQIGRRPIKRDFKF